MPITFKTPTGAEIIIYTQGEEENSNGEPCYIASKVQGSPYVFLARKSACRHA
jgi:hypothetical protein